MHSERLGIVLNLRPLDSLALNFIVETFICFYVHNKFYVKNKFYVSSEQIIIFVCVKIHIYTWRSEFPKQ